MKHTHEHGFSLIELAVVLAVIGLIAGGVLGGKALLRSSALRSVISDTNLYKSSIQQFKSQYTALPGDMINATSYWGTDSSGCPNGGGASGTCNGNGDKLIAINAATVDERYRIWQQLSLAGFLPGKFSGVSTSPIVINVNVPGSKYDPSAYYAIAYLGALSGNATYFDGIYNNNLTIFSYFNGAPAGVMVPEDAMAIDMKMDDGKPGRGIMMAHYSTTKTRTGVRCTNATVSTDLDTTYNLTNPGQDCIVIFPRFL